MRALDGLLDIVVTQDATELRLAANRPPRLFRDGVERALTMPATPPALFESMVGPLLATHRPALQEHGSARLTHRTRSGVDFDVVAQQLPDPDDGGLEVRFTRRTTAAAPAPSDTAPTAAPAPGIEAILAAAAALGASDVHLASGATPIARVDGELRPLRGVPPLDVATLLPDPAQLERVRSGRSVDLGLDAPGVGRVRVNVYAANDGLAAAIRLLACDAPALGDLGLPPALESLVALPHGLVIACGPTGSGKSTTLAALARQALASRARVLITLEDPIEYRIPAGAGGGLVRQREIGREVRDFATGLRDALREDPDVLLIGEMRDPETIELALTAAETGHLVLTSLHSRTSASAIERIVDIYPPERQRQIRVQLADALRAVIGQRLLPRADGQGRVAAVELLRVNFGVAHMIREGKTAQIPTAMQSGADDGMVALERSLADLVRTGRVALDAARAVAADPRGVDDWLNAPRPR